MSDDKFDFDNLSKANKEFFESLTPNEFKSLIRDYGLKLKNEKFLDELRERFEVTRKRIQRIEEGALYKLRKSKENYEDRGDKTYVEFAKASDAVEIGKLSQHYVEHGLGWRYTPRRIRKLISNKSKNVVVARNGGELTGFGIMTYERDQANLDLLGVKVSYRRQGIGTLIVEWLEEVANLAGVYNVYVQVRKANESAVKFYQKLDYLVIDEKKGYYQGKETAVIMCKNIRQMLNN